MVKSTQIGEIYTANRCKGWSQAKSMERVIAFTKKNRTTRESVIRKMLNAEKRFNKNKWLELINLGYTIPN